MSKADWMRQATRVRSWIICSTAQADVGIVFGPDAVQESQRIRVVAVSERGIIPPRIHSMAMERYCPNRALCEEFLGFIQSPEAQKELQRLGYARRLKASPRRNRMNPDAVI